VGAHRVNLLSAPSWHSLPIAQVITASPFQSDCDPPARGRNGLH